MKRIGIFAIIMSCIALGAIAQVTPPAGTPAPPAGTPTPPAGTPAPPAGGQVPAAPDTRGLSFPYIAQGTYNAIVADSLPQNIQASFGTDYSGVNGAKWEYNNDVYRGSFEQEGKNTSVLYGKDGKKIETRTAIKTTDLPQSVQDSTKGKDMSLPHEIRIGDKTFYSTQVDGKEVFYDSNGKTVKAPGMN